MLAATATPSITFAVIPSPGVENKDEAPY